MNSQLIPRLSTIDRSYISNLFFQVVPLHRKTLSRCLHVSRCRANPIKVSRIIRGGDGSRKRRGQSWPVTRAYWPRRGAGIMTTRVRTGEKIYRGLFLELSPSVSFETAGHHDPDHVQSAGGREREKERERRDLGERWVEREGRPQGGEKSKRRSNKREFRGGEKDRIGY